MFNKRTIANALVGLPLGTPLHFHESIGSTNDEARRLAIAGAPSGTLVIADEQTAGRGRAARSWSTPPGTAIAASFVLQPDIAAEQTGLLSLIGGLAAALAIEDVTNLRPVLKWPNDVWLASNKVCGVLPEASQTVITGRSIVEWVVLGIGINVNGTPPTDIDLRHPATTLEVQIGYPIDRTQLLKALAHHLATLTDEPDGEYIRSHWNNRLLWRDERVCVQIGAETIEGTIREVNAHGQLLLRTNQDKTRTISAGEIRRVSS